MRKRLVTVGAVLALVGIAGAWAATRPAKASTDADSSAAAAATVNRFYFHDGPEALADGGSTIASIVLPKGNWVVTVKLWVDKAVPGGDLFTSCSLGLGSGSGADGDNAAYLAPTTGGGAGAAVLTMSASHRFSSAGSLTVSCGDNGTNAQYHQLRIQAVKVGSIVRTPI